MKFLRNQKELSEIKKSLKNADYCISSRSPGSVNVYFMFSENRLTFDYWKNESDDEICKNAWLMDYGEEEHGNVLICNFAEKFQAELFGAGKKHSGRILFIQRKDETYSVVFNRDGDDSNDIFKMSSTDDAVIIKIILLLVAELFPTLENSIVTESLSLLITPKSELEDKHG